MKKTTKEKDPDQLKTTFYYRNKIVEEISFDSQVKQLIAIRKFFIADIKGGWETPTWGGKLVTDPVLVENIHRAEKKRMAQLHGEIKKLKRVEKRRQRIREWHRLNDEDMQEFILKPPRGKAGAPESRRNADIRALGEAYPDMTRKELVAELESLSFKEYWENMSPEDRHRQIQILVKRIFPERPLQNV